MATILSLREQLAKAAAEREARLTAEQAINAAPATKKPVTEPAPEHRRDLSLEMGADEIMGAIASALSGKLPGSLEGALASLPELKAVTDEVFLATPGLKEGVEKRYAGLLKKQAITTFKEEIADSFGDRLGHRLWERLVAFGAATTLTSEQQAAINAANKAADDHRTNMKEVSGHPSNCKECRKTFIHESRDREGATHCYLPTEPWLQYALQDRYRVIQNARKAWKDTLRTLNVSEGRDVDSKDALLNIAMGRQLVTVVYLPYPKDGEERIMVGGRVVHGRYIVQGIEPNESGVPQMVLVPFEEAASSSMYPALHSFFPPAVFEFKPLRDKAKPGYAFNGLQEKSGKPAGLVRKILMHTLGEGRKHAYSTGSGHQPTTFSVAFKAAASPPVAVAHEIEPVVEVPVPQPSRKARREEKRKEGERGRSQDGKERGGAKNLTRDAQQYADE